MPAFGVDFTFHIDKPTRIWLAGGDPYADKEKMFSYPPIVTRLFMWVKLTTPEVSVRIWISVAALFAAVGAIAAARWRTRLGLGEIPGSMAAAVILFSTPVLFALERSNYDLLIVPCIVAAALAIRRNSDTADAVAGFLLAIAIWAKLYPGLLLLAVLALRRWRLAAWLAAWCALIGLSDVPELMRFNENNRTVLDTARALGKAFPDIHPWNHPLTSAWPSLWSGTPLASIPGELGTALIVGSLIIWVSWYLFRCVRRELLVLPYMFWVVAAGSFVPPVSNDYNLTPLPLAVLATWSPRDRWSVHLAIAALILWWQPISLPLPGRVLLFIKLAGLIAAAGILVSRAIELREIRAGSPP